LTFEEETVLVTQYIYTADHFLPRIMIIGIKKKKTELSELASY
jgi:hypothetical protein